MVPTTRLPAPLARLAARRAEAGIFCDFDGCLAPIVADPAEARASRGASAVLARLARRWRVVAVISGRSLADLSRRVRAPGVRLFGLHGIEEARDGSVRVSPEALAAEGAVVRAAARLERELAGLRGVALERKGLALAVHFRRAADPEGAERMAAPFVGEAARAEGLAVFGGRRILEVRPASGGDKGGVVRRILGEERLAAALVAGDDVGDLPAFEAAGEAGLVVRIAVESSEAPDALLDRADLVVASPEDLVRLLRLLARDP